MQCVGIRNTRTTFTFLALLNSSLEEEAWDRLVHTRLASSSTGWDVSRNCQRNDLDSGSEFNTVSTVALCSVQGGIGVPQQLTEFGRFLSMKPRNSEAGGDTHTSSRKGEFFILTLLTNFLDCRMYALLIDGETVAQHGCQPILEAHWVVLRVAVYPTAIAVLRERLLEYARLTRIPGRDLSLLFGIETQSCHIDSGHGIAMLRAPDIENETPASHIELESLALLIQEKTFLDFRDINHRSAVWIPFGGGPFAIDDALSYEEALAYAACAMKCPCPNGMTFGESGGARVRLGRRDCHHYTPRS